MDPSLSLTQRRQGRGWWAVPAGGELRAEVACGWEKPDFSPSAPLGPTVVFTWACGLPVA